VLAVAAPLPAAAMAVRVVGALFVGFERTSQKAPTNS
jgi:hypothetical protein